MADGAAVTAAVVTVSDSCARGEREDRSGPAVAQLLQKLRFSIAVREVVPDESISIQNLLIRLAREVQARRDDRWNRNCCARRDAGSDGRGVRPVARRRGGTDAERGHEEDSVCRAEPGSLRSTGERADPEFAGKSGGSSGIPGGGRGVDSARVGPARGEDGTLESFVQDLLRFSFSFYYPIRHGALSAGSKSPPSRIEREKGGAPFPLHSFDTGELGQDFQDYGGNVVVGRSAIGEIKEAVEDVFQGFGCGLGLAFGP